MVCGSGYVFKLVDYQGVVSFKTHLIGVVAIQEQCFMHCNCAKDT